jgi:hypothetical protein
MFTPTKQSYPQSNWRRSLIGLKWENLKMDGHQRLNLWGCLKSNENIDVGGVSQYLES